MARPRQFDEVEVIDKATDLFWEKGYKRTTPADLAVATGLSKSSLYNAFGNKEGLFLRALAHYTAEQQRMVASGLGGRSLRGGLEWLYEQLIAVSVSPDEGGMGRSCLICSTAVDTEPGAEALNAQLRRSRASMRAVFQARLTQAQEAGELAEGKDLATLADFLFSTNSGLNVLARAGATAEEMRAVARQAINSVLD